MVFSWRAGLSVVAGIGLALLTVEGCLRLSDRNDYTSFVNDPVSGLLTHRPSSAYHSENACFQNLIVINREGFHAREHARQKPPGVFRIAILGSSFVEGEQLPVDQTFPALVEDRFQVQNATTTKRVEVLSYGFSGNGTYLNLLYFLRFAAQYQPDLVIDLTTDYDAERILNDPAHPIRRAPDGSVVAELPPPAHAARQNALKALARSSKLFMHLYALSTLMRQNRDVSVSASSTVSGLAALPWQTEEDILRAFKQAVAARGARFMLMSWQYDWGGSVDPTSLASQLVPIAMRERIPYLDLQPALAARQRETGLRPTWSCDGHWNAVGHAWAAQALQAWLNRQPELL